MDRHTILIVEEDRLLALLLATNLSAMGYRVVGNVESPAVAIEIASDLRPHAVLMAVSLDDRDDALGAAEHIKGRLGIPIVFLSGVLDAKLKQRARKISSGMIINKPFDEYILPIVLDGIFSQAPKNSFMNWAT